MRSKTLNRGAADIIAQVIRKVDRMCKAAESSKIDGDALIDWLQDWDARAAKKAGGLGRK